jgi:hypothetical protein
MGNNNGLSLIYILRDKFLFKDFSSSQFLALNEIANQKKWRQIKNQLKFKKVQVLVAESASYIITLSPEKLDKKLSRETILKEAQKYIPIELTSQNFDWYKKNKWIQVLAIPADKLNILSWMSQQLKFKINTIQSVPIILASEFASTKEPLLIVNSFGQETILMITLNGVVGLTYTARANLTKTDIINLTNLAKEKLGWKTQTIVSINKSLDKSIGLSAKWKIIDKQINLMAKVGSKKKSASKKDEDVLEIKPTGSPVKPTESAENQPSLSPKANVPTPTTAETANKQTSPPNPLTGTAANLNTENPAANQTMGEINQTQSNPPASEIGDEATAPAVIDDNLNAKGFSTDQTPSKFNGLTANSKSIFVVTGLILILGGLIAGGVFYSKASLDNRAKATEQPKKATQTSPSPSPSPTPEEKVDLSTYNIQVLNGSGVAGRAGEVSTLLTETGFEKSSTGNADSYDYTQTEVKIKKDIPNKVFKEIEKALKDNYDIKQKKLDENSKFDVVIIVGEKNT